MSPGAGHFGKFVWRPNTFDGFLQPSLLSSCEFLSEHQGSQGRFLEALAEPDFSNRGAEPTLVTRGKAGVDLLPCRGFKMALSLKRLIRNLYVPGHRTFWEIRLAAEYFRWVSQAEPSFLMRIPFRTSRQPGPLP